MSSVRFSDPGDRHLQGRFTRTNSGSLDLDLNLARDELARAQDALLRPREKQHRLYVDLEDDDFNYHASRYEDDELEEMVRRRRQSIEQGAQTARHVDTDRPIVIMRPSRPLSDVSSSVLDSRRETRSSTPSQIGRSSVSSWFRRDRDYEMERLREHERFFPDPYPTTRNTTSSRPSDLGRFNPILSAPRRPVARPKSVRLDSPPGELATPSTEVPPIIPNLEPSPEAKMRNKLLDLLWSQPVGLIHDHLSKSMVKGSGEWIFALPAFENWRKATTESPEGVKRGENCLWLQGNLGTGKTMLM